MKKQKGLTLVEMILAAVLLGMILASTVYVLSTGLDSWSGQEERSEALESARFAYDMITRELRYGEDVVSTGSGLLEFEVKGLEDGSGNTVDKIKYELSGDRLLRYEDDALSSGYEAANEVANNVAAFSSSWNASTGIAGFEISVDAQAEDITLTGSVLLRSYKP